jgi:hypothetical protein
LARDGGEFEKSGAERAQLREKGLFSWEYAVDKHPVHI